MKVLIIGDASSTNLGDPVLTSSTEYLVNKICLENNISCKTEIFDIVGRKNTASEQANPALKIKRKNKWLVNIKVLIKWFLREKKAFLKRIYSAMENEDNWVFVVAGGAFISDSLVYGLRLRHICDIAKKENIKVIFNSIGIEKSVFCSINYFNVRKMLKNRAITHFSTRDSVETVRKLTKRKEFYIQSGDSGLFAAETFNVKKKDEDVVGIGVISLSAYRSVIGEPRARKITEESLMEFWHNIVDNLEKNNIKWKMFTNGGAKDYALARKFIDKYNYSEDKLLPLPQIPKELIESISGFKAVIAHRLHSLIISTSLGIPVVPIQWSKKIRHYAELIGASRYTLWPEAENGYKAASYVQGEDFLLREQVVSNVKKKTVEYLENALLSAIGDK